MSDYLHTCVDVDGVSVDVLLTKEEVKTATQRALDNLDCVPNNNQCWPISCPQSKCSLLQWIMGKCCECGDCDE